MQPAAQAPRGDGGHPQAFAADVAATARSVPLVRCGAAGPSGPVRATATAAPASPLIHFLFTRKSDSSRLIEVRSALSAEEATGINLAGGTGKRPLAGWKER